MPAQIYQMYVKELSVLLAEGPNGPEPGTESAQQLEVLVKDLVCACPRPGWNVLVLGLADIAQYLFDHYSIICFSRPTP
jgi:hypothetical protein